MKKVLILSAVVMVLTSFGLAGADETTPYLVGEWFLADISTDTPAVTTTDSQFIFLNPTTQKQYNENAFFDPNGGFCGCDRDVRTANGRIRYTMSDEKAGGQFICTGGKGPLDKPLQTEGTLKTIAFTVVNTKGTISFGTATTAGHQVHFGLSIDGFPANNTESMLAPVALNSVTRNEMNAIHTQCVSFCQKANAINPGQCPDLVP
jgi:hypothetical protein